jgi:hypothetical protein
MSGINRKATHRPGYMPPVAHLWHALGSRRESTPLRSAPFSSSEQSVDTSSALAPSTCAIPEVGLGGGTSPSCSAIQTIHSTVHSVTRSSRSGRDRSAPSIPNMKLLCPIPCPRWTHPALFDRTIKKPGNPVNGVFLAGARWARWLGF